MNIVSPVPPITQELLQKNDELQREIQRALNSPKRDMRTGERIRHLMLLKNLKEQMSDLFDARRAMMRRKDDVTDIENQIAEVGKRAAKAAFHAGEFETARELVKDKNLRAFYKSFIDAMNRDDNEHCEHPKYSDKKHPQGNFPIPNYFRERDIFSPKHGRVVAIMKCNLCDFRNIAPLTKDLAEMSERRAAFAAKELAQT